MNTAAPGPPGSLRPAQPVRPVRPHTGRRRNEAAREAILRATVDLMRDGAMVDTSDSTLDGTFTLGYGDEPNQNALGAIARAGAGSFSKGDVDTIVAVFRDLASFF